MARMTKQKQVADDFVNRIARSSKSAMCSGSLRHDGTCAYSYAQPIAVHASSDGVKRIEMIDRRWSVTTSRHQAAIRYAAARNGFEVVLVDRF